MIGNYYALAILRGLQQKTHMYGGTVDPTVIARRRKANKAARIARRINRGKR